MIGLTTNEVKVFKKLSLNPKSVADIVRVTKLPRMTVYTNLLRLHKKKFAKKVYSETGKRILWARNMDSVIGEELSRATHSILGRNSASLSGVNLHHGEEEIGDVLMSLTVRKDGARMYSIQNSKNWDMWLKLLGKEWVNKHNRAVVTHKLLTLTLHSLEAPEGIQKDKEITDAYRGRLGNSHAVPEEFLPKGLSLYIVEDTILLVDLEKVQAISFTDNSLAKFIISMFMFMFEQSEQEAFFQKFNR